MKPITILLTDDHGLFRESWSCVINCDSRFQVVAQAASGEEAVQLAIKLRPDIVTMDINLPEMTGLEATALINKYCPSSKVLAVSMHSQPVYARKMMRQGAMGYITKNSPRKEMFHAIIEVHKGAKYICNEIKNILSEHTFSDKGGDKQPGSLSRREKQIVEHIVKGYGSKEIAESLGIAAKTVEIHRYRILRKLDLKNSAALVNFYHYQRLS